MQIPLHDREKMRTYGGRSRYFLIEPDGSWAGFSAWQQRPSAERQARGGLGVYDRREDAVIVEPDLSKRIAQLLEELENLERRAGRLIARVEQLRKLEHERKEHPNG